MSQGSKKLSVVVAGGSGFLGRAVTAALQAKQHHVTWISRSLEQKTPNDVEVVTWSHVHKQGLPKCDAVCNVAGCSLFWPWTDKLKSQIRNSRIGTTDDLVKVILEKPTLERPKTYVGVSGVGYYPPSESDSQQFDETSPGGEHDFLAVLAKDWERASLPLEQNGIRRVIVRTGVVLGNGGGALQSMYVPFFLGLGGPIGSGQQAFPWIHLYDHANLLVHAIEMPHVSGLFNGVAPEQLTNKAFSNALAAKMNRPALLPFPGFVLKYLLNEDRANMLLKGSFVNPKRTLESSFVYKFPTIDTALADLIQ